MAFHFNILFQWLKKKPKQKNCQHQQVSTRYCPVCGKEVNPPPASQH